jgi:hypothetical protein
MRLQLVHRTLLVASLLVARTGRTDPLVSVDARGSVYHDSDRTTIGTTTGVVRAAPLDRLSLKARYLADVISTASVDVTSAATPSFEEIRHEAEGAVSYHDGTRTADVSYIFSREPDWRSHTIAGGLGHDLFNHQLTLGLGGTLVLNRVGRSGDPNFGKSLTSGGASVSATVIASPRDLVNVAYSLNYSAGYQSSPYRQAYLRDPSGTSLTIGVPEVHPEVRIRHALAMRYNRWLFRKSALRMHARGYLDDWGIASLTAGVEYVIGFGPMEVGLHVRGYGQVKARFYQPIYPEPARFMTADRELGTFIDGFAGARLTWLHEFSKRTRSLKAELKVDGFGFKYFDFPRLPKRYGLIAELGVGVAL